MDKREKEAQVQISRRRSGKHFIYYNMRRRELKIKVDDFVDFVLLEKYWLSSSRQKWIIYIYGQVLFFFFK